MNRVVRTTICLDNIDRIAVKKSKKINEPNAYNYLVICLDSDIVIEIAPDTFELLFQKARDAR